jgi:hypothetical protein
MLIYIINLKALIMKQFILILIASIGISFCLSAQSAGDYRSVSSGNWNDATKWETYNGSSWVSATSYPGQNAGTGTVTIMHETEIKITASVPHPIANLSVITDYQNSYDMPEIVPSAVLSFSSEIAVTLNVSGDVSIRGNLKTENKNGAKSHTLSIGRNLDVGEPVYLNYDCYCWWSIAEFQTINQDDKINITFNTTDPTSMITGPIGIAFHDVTFNGTGITVSTPISIAGTAAFISGIINLYFLTGYDAGEHMPGFYGGSISFLDGSKSSGGSNVSYIEGEVVKVGDDPFTFPIGSAGLYAPLTISAPVGQSEVFVASYRRGNLGYKTVSDSALLSISYCEMWELYPTSYSANYPLDVTVGWTPSSSCSYTPGYISNVSEVTLAHANWDEPWDRHGGAGTGTISNGSVTMTGVSTFGYFTLANVGSACQIPSGLTTSNITSNSAIAEWTAVANAESYTVYYRPGYGTTWINVATSTTSTTTTLSGLNQSSTYDLIVRANCNSSSSHYRQVQFKTIAACGTPTGLSATNITSTSSTLNWSAVPNAINYSIEYSQSGASYPIATATGITSLSYNLSGLSVSTGYNWAIKAYCPAGFGLYATSFLTTSPICVDNHEINNTSSQAKAISIGNAISSGINSTIDVDWFIVTMPNNSNTNLEVRLSALPADYDLYVYNKSLKLIGSSTNSGTSNEVVIYNSNTRNATYYIKLIGKNGAFNSSQCYTLLAQTISGGNRTTSHASAPIIEVDEDINKQFLYPNPASEFVHLSFNSTIEGPVNVKIFNTAGQLIKQSAIKITNGYNQTQIPVSDIIPGIYVLRINKGELNMTRKFVIAR